MTSVKNTQLRIISSARKLVLASLASFAVATTGGCMARTLTVNVVVMNYTPSAVAYVSVNGQDAGGFYHAYAPGTIGGTVYCCIDVKPGPAHVRWQYDTTPSDTRPDDFFKRDVVGIIPKPNGPYKYLGVHIYPDDHVEFTLSRDIPEEKKEGEP